ncbi:hypothetical protein SteCoe_10533 [Stentor coeruleus]|uniref:Uncharacterized protein n=1 Tax=Stentor coeruleus TaxID=5963 RepID=A0A1R2CF95_9CILI|nr:hypothetical protein SteCoe_10533 [Stentor coeruleus]
MKVSRSINASLSKSPGSTLNTARARTNRFKIPENFQKLDIDQIKKPRMMLKTLTSRLRQDKTQSIPPDVAVKVVKNYILPMFESETRSKLNTQRSESFGHRYQFSVDGGTVYSELKLSEKLSKEILSLESHLTSMDQIVKDNNQEKEKVTQENQKLELELINALTNISFINGENTRLQRELIGVKLNIGQITSQLKKYKNLYETTQLENERITKLLQDEKASNDIRFFNMFFP